MHVGEVLHENEVGAHTLDVPLVKLLPRCAVQTCIRNTFMVIMIITVIISEKKAAMRQKNYSDRSP